MNNYESEIILKSKFSLNSFYDEYWDTISRVLNGERILVIQKTGFGKSLYYQFTATQLVGLIIIFHPLITLIRDQIKTLRKKGINAAAINSEE